MTVSLVGLMAMGLSISLCPDLVTHATCRGHPWGQPPWAAASTVWDTLWDVVTQACHVVQPCRLKQGLQCTLHAQCR